MTFKVNSLNSFDKGFFGKTMQAYAKENKGKVQNSSKLELSSIDDLNKYFSKKMFTERLEKSPTTDVFKTETPVEPDFSFPNLIQ